MLREHRAAPIEIVSLGYVAFRELHAKPEARVHDLIRRGQAEGSFRRDLPVKWLAGVLFHLMKGAAADFSRGHLDPADAPRFLAETALAAYADQRPGPTADHL